MFPPHTFSRGTPHQHKLMVCYFYADIRRTQLLSMEMEVLNTKNADDFAQSLSTFLLGLDDNAAPRRRSMDVIHDMFDDHGYIIEKNDVDNAIATGSGIDLSTQAAAQRPKAEMLATLLCGSTSAVQRSKSGIYNERGDLVKQWSNVKGPESISKQFSPDESGSPQTTSNVKNSNIANADDEKRKQDFEAIMRDRSLSREDRTRRIQQLKQKSPPEQHDTSSSGKEPVGGSKIVLSALDFARKSNEEMKATLLTSEVTVKERSKDEIYDSNGLLTKQWKSGDINDEDDGINLSAQAASKKAAKEVDSLLVKTKTGGGLQDRMSKYKQFVAPRGGYHHEEDEHNEERMKSLDISVESVSRKAREMKETTQSWSQQNDTLLEKQKQEQFQAIMRDRNLTKTERAEAIEALKKQFSSPPEIDADQKGHDPDTNNKRAEMKLSAQFFAKKPSLEIKALLHTASVSASNAKQEMYDEKGKLIKQWASGQSGDGQVNDHKQVSQAQENQGSSLSRDQVGFPSDESSTGNSCLRDEERKKLEFQSIMRDHTLTREDRALAIEALQRKYSSASTDDQFIQSLPSQKQRGPPSNQHGNSADLDAQRRAELQSIMRNRTLGREKKNQMMEEVKLKYDLLDSTVKEEKDVARNRDGSQIIEESAIDLSAAAFSQKALMELEAVKGRSAKGDTVKDKKAAFSNNTTVYYDSVSFALSEKKRREEMQRAKRESAGTSFSFVVLFASSTDGCPIS